MADEFNYNDTGNTNQNGGTQDSGYANVGSSGTNAANNDGYANGSGNGYSTGNGSYQYTNQNYNNYQNGNNGGRKKGRGALKALFAVLLAVIFGVCAGAGAYGISRLYNDKDNDETEVATITEGDEAEDADVGDADDSDNKAALELKSSDEVHTAVTEVAQNVMPSIVSVYNNYTAQTQSMWGQVYSQEATSTGSGIIIANTGDELLIATNNHVVADADSLEVQFIDESTAAANLKGTDSGNDLAVIAVSLDDIDDDTMDEIAVASLGSSDDLQIGEPVVAIGNALGYGQSVTTGVVSALNREMTTEDGETGTFIQTDAAINPGNSGGALVDLNGNVIGINSSKIGGTTVEGMGYAIPMSMAEPIIEKLASQDTKIAVDESEQGYLGIAGVSVTSQVSSAYNMPQGAYVAEIYEGTGAADSDLQKGDIITAVDGSTVDSMTELKDELTYHAAGDEITLTVQRASGSGEYSEMEIRLTLSSQDDMPSEEETTTESGAKQDQQGGNGSNGSNGSNEGQQNQQGQQGGNTWGYQFPWGNFGN